MKSYFFSFSVSTFDFLFSSICVCVCCSNNGAAAYSTSHVPRSSGEWKRKMGLLDEADLFMELIRDVSNELDIDVLCHKILVNVSLLTRADRGSLFLAKGPSHDKYLVAKLFDVTVDTGKCRVILIIYISVGIRVV